MQRLIGCVLIVLAVTARLAADDQPKAPLAKLSFASGDTIVFLGDSITAQGLYTQYVENYFFTRMPGTRLKFHNAGVSGDTAANALERFDRDVAAYRPKYVFVLLGMNDGAAKSFDEKLFETYQADLRRLVAKIQAIPATPIVMTPTMYDWRAARLNPKPDSRGRGGYFNGVLALYGAWLREFAVEEGLGFVDLYGPLNQFTNQSRKTNPNFTLIPDGIHPDAGGQIIMAYSLVSDLGLSKRISTIELSRSATGDATAKVTGGKLSDARFTERGVEFTFQPASLPLSVPAAAKVGADLIPLGHRLSYEALYVHGLAPGRYQITINDAAVGEHTADVLASKLELQSNDRTPQYQQAVRVAELNAQRTERCILPLRDLWRAKKTLDRTRRELAQSPNDETLQKRATAYERKLADFDGQIAVLERAARELEDKIYQTNQPSLLRYRIERITDNP